MLTLANLKDRVVTQTDNSRNMRIPRRRSRLLLAIAIPGLLMAAQESAPLGFEQWTPVSLKQYEQKMRDDAAADPITLRCSRSQIFPTIVPCWFTGKARARPSGVKLRRTFSLFSPLLVGGTLLNGETVSPHEKRNGTIQGGPQEAWRGDVVRIPLRVPHQVWLEGAHEFDYFVIKNKRILKPS
jgi:hypothetical protein